MTGELMDTNFLSLKTLMVTLGMSVLAIAANMPRSIDVAYTNVSIDVEDGAISHQVASRFFSPHEYQWLNQKPAVNQAVLRNLLWRLKECSIKTHQNADKQLIKELKHDVLDELGEEVINQLIGIDEINDKGKPIQCVQTDAKIVGNFSSKPCSFIIVNR
ncbi:MAG: 4'-phosphopantetheinyl transferase superfamily protein [Moraxella sp.]